MLILAILTFLIVLGNYHKFLAISFDHEFASTRGLNVTKIYLLMVLLIAIAVVMLIQVVGIILVIALLSIPPYLASYTAKSMESMMLFSFLWSAIFCILGIILAYFFNISPGASIIGVGVILGFLFLAVRKSILHFT